MAETRSTPLVTLNHCRNDQRVTISSLQAEFRQYQTEILEAKKMTTMAETRSAAATRSQANASQIYKPTSERDESTSTILLLRTEFNEFKNEMREMLNTLLTSRQPYAGTQTWDEVKKENPDSDFKANSNILGAEGKKSYEEKHQADKEAYLQVITNEKREREAMKLLEDEQKQKTATELLDQSLHFVQEAEQDNNKKAKKITDPLKPTQPISAGNSRGTSNPNKEIPASKKDSDLQHVEKRTNQPQHHCAHEDSDDKKYAHQCFFYGSLTRPPEEQFSNLKPWGQGFFGREDLIQEMVNDVDVSKTWIRGNNILS